MLMLAPSDILRQRIFHCTYFLHVTLLLVSKEDHTCEITPGRFRSFSHILRKINAYLDTVIIFFISGYVIFLPLV